MNLYERVQLLRHTCNAMFVTIMGYQNDQLAGIPRDPDDREHAFIAYCRTVTQLEAAERDLRNAQLAEAA